MLSTKFYISAVPHKHRGFITFCVFLLLALCIFSVQPFSTLAQDDLLESLTLEQRVGQMFMVNLFGGQITEAGRDFLERYQPGAVVLIGENTGTPQHVTRLTNAFQEAIIAVGGLPLLVAVDQEGGPISHLRDGFTLFPTPMLLTATGDIDLARRVGAAMAAELRAVGVTMNLAPVADLETNPDNPIIVRRSFGGDPALVSPIIAGFIEGMQNGGVVATVKHFPGHGDSSEDSHVGLPVVNLSRERLQQVEIAPFRASIEAGAEAVMAAHIWYPALEPQENLPASMSYSILTGLLRGEMAYNGLIVTDALDMDAIDTVYRYPDAALRAVQAGADMIVSAHIGLDSQAQAIQLIVDAVRAGEISEERINQSVRRILDVKARYGLLDWTPLDVNTASERVDVAGHQPLIEELFRKGITVAHDQNGVIPLSADASVALVYPATRPQIAAECGLYHSALRLVGVSDYPTDEEIAWATDAAARTDITIVFTQNADTNVQQSALVRALPQDKTIAVALWSPYDWLSFPNVSAYMATYSPATEAVPAACGVLFGEIPAKGRWPLP